MSAKITIRGARQHNLKNIDLDLPRNQLIVFTGVSGSGKSSLAFDTIFAEGQRRYVESLSAYARQFLGQLDKPDVDSIEGLSPAISIDQKSTSNNPRSTVGTVTEIYDYLRLLYGRAGEPFCPKCGQSIAPQTIDEMCDRIVSLPEKSKIHLLAPVIRGKKGNHSQLLSGLRSQGFARVKVNGEIRELADNIELQPQQKHDISVVVDRLIVKPKIQERLSDSLSTCLKIADGIAIVEVLDSPPSQETTPSHSLQGEDTTPSPSLQVNKTTPSPSFQGGGEEKAPLCRDVALLRRGGWGDQIVFSENFACPTHGAVIEELSPRLFSFNSPYGACSNCHGLGTLKRFSPDLVIPDPSASVRSAIAPWQYKDNDYYMSLLEYTADEYKYNLSDSWDSLSEKQQQIVLYGDKEIQNIQYGYYRGVIPMLEKTYRETNSEIIKQKLEQYIEHQTCGVCEGKRLKPETLSVRLGQYNINHLTSVSIDECLEKINQIELTPRQAQIGELALKEIRERLQFLLDVGLNYLTLDRTAMTLSGGEAQRIRLATQIGSGLTGVLYVLDEPSIGLHQRDNDRLLETLKKLRDLDNTLIIVEHDEDTIKFADYIVDIGP